MPRKSSSPKDVRVLVDRFVKELVSLIEASAKDLAGEVVLQALAGMWPARKDGSAAGKTRRRPAASPAQHEARVLQGRYMGKMRGLSKGDRAKVKALRAKAGIAAAIKLADELGS